MPAEEAGAAALGMTTFHRRKPTPVNVVFDADSPDTKIMESDPTGRYVRYDKLLGRGACKRVYLGFDREEGMEVAWNQVELVGQEMEKETKQRLFAEISVLQQLKHRNVMSLKHWWFEDKKQTINFITEVFTAGTLRQYRRKARVMNEHILKRWAYQIIEGLVYLHGHDPPIVHRDLKCDNIFINSTTGVIKIGDLGLATAQRGLSVVGTPEFMAPEIYEEQYDEKVDIYSFGMSLLELAVLEYPYSECHGVAQIFRKVTQGVPPQALTRVQSPELRQLIELCIGFDPAMRPSARMLLKHPYFETLRHELPHSASYYSLGGAGSRPGSLASSPRGSMPHLPSMLSQHQGRRGLGLSSGGGAAGGGSEGGSSDGSVQSVMAMASMGMQAPMSPPLLDPLQTAPASPPLQSSYTPATQFAPVHPHHVAPCPGDGTTSPACTPAGAAAPDTPGLQPQQTLQAAADALQAAATAAASSGTASVGDHLADLQRLSSEGAEAAMGAPGPPQDLHGQHGQHQHHHHHHHHHGEQQQHHQEASDAQQPQPHRSTSTPELHQHEHEQPSEQPATATGAAAAGATAVPLHHVHSAGPLQQAGGAHGHGHKYGHSPPRGPGLPPRPPSSRPSLHMQQPGALLGAHHPHVQGQAVHAGEGPSSRANPAGSHGNSSVSGARSFMRTGSRLSREAERLKSYALQIPDEMDDDEAAVEEEGEEGRGLSPGTLQQPAALQLQLRDRANSTSGLTSPVSPNSPSGLMAPPGLMAAQRGARRKSAVALHTMGGLGHVEPLPLPIASSSDDEDDEDSSDEEILIPLDVLQEELEAEEEEEVAAAVAAAEGVEGAGVSDVAAAHFFNAQSSSSEPLFTPQHSHLKSRLGLGVHHHSMTSLFPFGSFAASSPAQLAASAAALEVQPLQPLQLPPESGATAQGEHVQAVASAGLDATAAAATATAAIATDGGACEVAKWDPEAPALAMRASSGQLALHLAGMDSAEADALLTPRRPTSSSCPGAVAAAAADASAGRTPDAPVSTTAAEYTPPAAPSHGQVTPDHLVPATAAAGSSCSVSASTAAPAVAGYSSLQLSPRFSFNGRESLGMVAALAPRTSLNGREGLLMEDHGGALPSGSSPSRLLTLPSLRERFALGSRSAAAQALARWAIEAHGHGHGHAGGAPDAADDGPGAIAAEGAPQHHHHELDQPGPGPVMVAGAEAGGDHGHAAHHPHAQQQQQHHHHHHALHQSLHQSPQQHHQTPQQPLLLHAAAGLSRLGTLERELRVGIREQPSSALSTAVAGADATAVATTAAGGCQQQQHGASAVPAGQLQAVAADGSSKPSAPLLVCRSLFRTHKELHPHHAEGSDPSNLPSFDRPIHGIIVRVKQYRRKARKGPTQHSLMVPPGGHGTAGPADRLRALSPDRAKRYDRSNSM